MRELDTVVRAPFAIVSAVRHGRIFHPHGVIARGHVDLGAHWWPVQGRMPVTARFSRGIGLPGPLPDLLGLAVRFHLATGPWDVLLVSAHLSTRVVPLPASGWAGARYSSVTAFRTEQDDTPTWLLAVPEPGQPRTGSLGSLVEGDPPHFMLSLATARGMAVPAGRLSLESPTALPDDMQPTFDPVVNCPDGVTAWPHWVAVVRRAAYGGGRGGRGAEESAVTGGDG